MQARMTSPLYLLPDVLKGLIAAGKVRDEGVSEKTLGLVHLRASQINGCAFCNDMHCRELKAAGAAEDVIWAVATWRESTLFSDAERAALSLTEYATRIADQSDPVPDAVWDEAKAHYPEKALALLIVHIGLINLFNRINVTIRQPADPAFTSAAVRQAAQRAMEQA
jgi:AhpD family alkylhydroperoxidase